MLKTALFLILNCLGFANQASARDDGQLARERADTVHLQHAILIGRANREWGDSQALKHYTETQRELMKFAVFVDPSRADIIEIKQASADRALQSRVDLAVTKMFSTSLGRSYFCAFASSTNLIAANFAVGPSAAKEVLRACRAKTTGTSLPLKVRTSVQFVQTKTPAPVESWSSSRGDIHLFFQAALSDEELLIRLVHEFYVRADRYWGFGGGSFAAHLSESPDLIREGAMAELFYDFFHRPLLRGTFLLMRAYTAEQRILSEIENGSGVSVRENFDSSNANSCWDLAKAVAIFVEPLQAQFAHTTQTRFRESDEVGQLQDLELAQSYERSLGLENRFCAFFSEPRVGRDGAFFTSGPRPRIGNGTDSKSRAGEKQKRLQNGLLLMQKNWPLSFPNKIEGAPKDPPGVRRFDQLIPKATSELSRSPAQAVETDRGHAEEKRALRLSMADMATFGDSRKDRVYGPIQVELLKVAIFPEGAKAQIKSIIVSSKVPAAQLIVDRVVLRFLDSASARLTFCRFLPNVEKAQDQLGISESAAEVALEKCRRGGVVPIANPKVQRFATKFSKQVVFVETENPAPVESYTSRKGDIHIFHNGTLSEVDLLRRLVHEFYVALDVNYVFTAKTADWVLDETDFKASGSKEAVTEYFNAFSNPILKGSFQLARAFYLENMVLEELSGIKTPNRRTDGCWDLIRSLAEQIESRQDLYLPQHLFIMRPEVRLAFAGGRSQVADVFAWVKALERKARVNKTLCEYLRLPAPSYWGTFLTSGPRPRIGNGTDSKSLKIAKKEWPLSFQLNDHRLSSAKIPLLQIPRTPIGPAVPDQELPTHLELPDFRGSE